MTTLKQQEFIPTLEQAQAIEHVNGPMLVVAGAGTGKTAVLSRRIAHLINSGAARPNEILAVTYTCNAASELIGRVAGILYPELPAKAATKKLERSGLQANTFHAYCYQLLKEEQAAFELIDETDLQVYLRQRIGELELRYFVETANLTKFLKDLLNFFDRCQDELRTPDDYDRYVARVVSGDVPLPRVMKSKTELSPDEVIGRCQEIARVYRQIESMLRRDGLGTFGHIITQAVAMLSRRPEVLQRAGKRARFILIDEFQDSNVAQIRLARLLGGDEANVFAVGDPDQAIYRFRGASSEAFDQFLLTFGQERVKRVTMSDNRRSTPPILNCAHEIIRSNPEVGGKDGGWPREKLNCARLQEEPELAKAPGVQVIVGREDEQEAEFIAATIDELRRGEPQRKLSDIAVLYAQHHHRKLVLEELRRRDIPTQVKGVDLFETPEIRDALAVLEILDGDNALALLRMAALPQFDVDPVSFRAEIALAGRDASFEPALAKAKGGARVVKGLREARQAVLDAEGSLAAAVKVAQQMFQLPESVEWHTLDGFAEGWLKKPAPLSGKGTLHKFLEYLDMYRDAGGVLAENNEGLDPIEALSPREPGVGPQDAVQLMTIHAAKGLEFPYVFVIRVKGGCLPKYYKEAMVEFPRELRNYQTVSSDDMKALDAQEQRRLFYVAMTRAEDMLYASAKIGTGKKQPVPTQYLRELVERKGLLNGSLDYRLLPEERRDIHAAAGAAALTISQWMELPPREDAKLNELSASGIDTYDRCPLAYKLKRDWRLPEEASGPLQYGQAMHTALKAYFDGVRAGRPPAEDVVIACFRDEFSKAKIAEPEQRRRYEADGIEQLTRFLSSALARPQGEILENEKAFVLKIDDIVVRGRIDRLERVDGNDVRVIDYKTGRAKSDDDAAESLQLTIYALAAKSEGKHAVSLNFVNLKDATLVEAVRSESDLLKAEEKVRQVAGEIAAGNFDARTGSHCRFCSYRSVCPAQEKQTATEPFRLTAIMS